MAVVEVVGRPNHVENGEDEHEKGFTTQKL